MAAGDDVLRGWAWGAAESMPAHNSRMLHKTTERYFVPIHLVPSSMFLFLFNGRMIIVI